jgi:hypothetical protein
LPKFVKPVLGNPVDSGNIADIYHISTKMWDNPQLIDNFLAAPTSGSLSSVERQIISNWRANFIKGYFIVIEHLPKYTVMMLKNTSDDDYKLYGVSGITDPISQILTVSLPFMVKTVLIPFSNKIVFDTILMHVDMTFTPESHASCILAYKKAKAKSGVIEKLGPDLLLLSPPPESLSEKIDQQDINSIPFSFDDLKFFVKVERVPKKMVSKFEEIADIILRFCDDNMNEEYKFVCLRALAKLSRMRPSPLLTSKPHVWASGIVYAIGAMNFIFDKTQPVHLHSDHFTSWFNISISSIRSKSRDVTNILELSYFNLEFTLPSRLDDNPILQFYRL